MSFYEEEGKERDKSSGRDEKEAGEEPALEPVAMGGENAGEEEVVAAIVTHAFYNESLPFIKKFQIPTDLAAGCWIHPLRDY